MKLTSKPLAVLVVVLIFGGIVFSSAMGWWQTEGGAQGGKNAGGQGEQEGSGGRYEAADTSIRGRTTFAEVLAWGVAEERIEAILGVPLPEDRATLIRDYCQVQGLEFGEVKAELQAVVDEVVK